MSFCRANCRRAIWVTGLATALLITAVASASARAPSATVRFHGYRLSVPAGWPVFDLARTPSTCVRFNRHAVYLGRPGSDQRCPAHAVGRVAAILVAPLSATASDAPGGAPGVILRSQAGSAISFTVPAAGVQVTATWAGDRSLMARILRRRLREATVRSRSSPPSGARASGRAFAGADVASARAAQAPRAIPAQAAYRGLGFDACSAPSTRTMAAWSSSSFRAIGVYIGGVNAACSQPNLTAAWGRTETNAGWHLIPTYVGLQGAGSCSGTCTTINPSRAETQGAAAATDAVNQAQTLGIVPGDPIYDDMEQYTESSANTAEVRAFLAGWTTELHADGYLSGVYSSASSGITDLVKAWGTGYTEPDDIWIADWNGQQTTNNPYVPSADWPGPERLHQYAGGHDATFGGVTLNIDSDYLNGATAGTRALIPDGSFVQVTGQPGVYRIAGGAPLFLSSWSLFGGPQPVTAISARQFAALPPYPVSGTFLTTTSGNVYRVAGGAPIPVTNWALFGGPQASVTIDEWDIDNIANPLSHLSSVPADGTVVEGLPSGAYWSFTGGARTAAGPTPGAVGVDDKGLAAFPVAPQTGGVGAALSPPRPVMPGCVVPRLKHMSLQKARSALTRAHCRLGKVSQPRYLRRHHLLHVFGQSVAPRSPRPAQFKVNVRLL